MDLHIQGGNNGALSPQPNPLERPLPPTPTDDEMDSGAESLGRPKALSHISSSKEEHRSHGQHHDSWSGEQSTEQRQAPVQTGNGQEVDTPPPQIEEGNVPDAQHAEGESSSQALFLGGAGARIDYEGPDLSSLDIYGSSGDEGSEHGDPVTRAAERATLSQQSSSSSIPRRRSSKSTSQQPVYPEAARIDGPSPRIDLPAPSRPLLSQTRRKYSSRTEVVVPRWQPDAEVTFCPICRTQFSQYLILA